MKKLSILLALASSLTLGGAGLRAQSGDEAQMAPPPPPPVPARKRVVPSGAGLTNLADKARTNQPARGPSLSTATNVPFGRPRSAGATAATNAPGTTNLPLQTTVVTQQATNVAETGAATNVAASQPPVRIGTNLPLVPGLAATSAPPASAATRVAPPPPPPGTNVPPPGGAAAATIPPWASLTNAIAPSSTNWSIMSGVTRIPEKFIALQAAPLEQVLTLYAELTGRTVLRPSQLAGGPITLINKTELTVEEAIQALDSVLALNGITMIPVGEKFVTAVQSQQALQEAAAFSKVDPSQLPEAGQYVTKIVTLKHAKPSDVQQLIQGFSKVQNGILAIEPSTLVLRDYAANIKRMMEIIDKVDVQPELDYKLEVIPIRYGKVDEIYSTMGGLIGGGGGGAVGATSTMSSRSRGTTTRTTGRGSFRSGTRGGMYGSDYGSSYGGYGGYGSRYGGSYYPQQARTGQVGQPATTAGQRQPGQTFQQRLQDIVSRTRSGAGSPGELLGDARIVPDERSNSLIVFATKEDMEMITNIVAKVDNLLAQVLIEAVIMDVGMTDSSELGVSASMSPRRTGRLTSIAGSMIGTNLVTDLTSGVLPAGQFSYIGKYAGDLGIVVKALAAKGRVQVLQTPRIQTSHATPASFFTGETVPYITSTYSGYGYGPSSQFQQLSVGIDLSVTPYITPDGLVVMEIDQNIEELSGVTPITGVGDMPNTTQRRASATVSVQDGDTIILGGYMRASKIKSRSGVPILKDIPILGALFRSSSHDNKRSELIVMLRPTVLHTPPDAAITAQAVLDKLPGLRELQKEMEEEELKRRDKADKATGVTTRPPPSN